jgi:hypothetical protein
VPLANSISNREFFDRAGAGLREFESASALEVQQAWLQKENANRSFFGHILKAVSCIKGTAYLR